MRPTKFPNRSPQVNHDGRLQSLRRVLYVELAEHAIPDGEVVVVGETCPDWCMNPYHAETMDQYDRLSSVHQERTRRYEDMAKALESPALPTVAPMPEGEAHGSRIFQLGVNRWLSEKEANGKWPKWSGAGMGVYPVELRADIEADARARRKGRLGRYKLD